MCEYMITYIKNCAFLVINSAEEIYKIFIVITIVKTVKVLWQAHI